MKRSLYIPSLFAVVLFSAGCQSETLPNEEEPGGESTLCFQPMLKSSGTSILPDAGTASRTKAADLVSADGSLSVPLWCEVSDGIGKTVDIQTKGKQLNTSGSEEDLGDDGFSISSFYVKAYKNSGTLISSYEQVTEGTDSLWRTSTSHSWGATENATFYSYANLPSATGAASVVSSSSASQTLTYDVSKVQSASAQTDILMGFYAGKSRYDATRHVGGIADIKFYHPLTAVSFKYGTFEGNPTVVIKKVSISGVYAKGKGTMTPPTGSATVPGISWTPTTASGTTTVTLGDGTSALSTTTVGTDKFIGEPFLLIPQDMTEQSAEVTVNLTLNGTAKTLKATITTGEWEAGKTNTYSLSYDPATYTFSLSSTTIVTTADKTFTNTTTSVDQSYSIYSKRILSTSQNHDWDIKSYQIGTADPVKIDESATSFTAGGLTVSEDKTNSKLKITAQVKTVESPGSNAYWRNTTTPARTDNLDWSPESWEGVGTIDLSKYDFKTDQRNAHSMTTANCYIIRHAGTYKIPLVYGNAVKDGEINTKAYKPGTSGSSNLSTYHTHKGIGITSPFIEYNKSSSSSSTNLSPTGCRVVWSENSGVITNINIPTSKESVTIGGTTYNISYLTFTIPHDKICQNNAIVQVSDGSGTMWSWHIWTTNDPGVAGDPIAVKPSSTKEYDFFPIYLLGWIDPSYYGGRSQMKITLVQKKSDNEITITVDQPRQAKEMSTGVMYQWGRKDPMPSKGSVDGFSMETSSSSGVSLATAIKNPGIAYYPTGTTGGNWCSTNYYNLWSGTLGTPIYSGSTKVITASNDATTKTVYDPSPVGYKVPSIYAYTTFSKTGATSTNVSDFNKKGDFNAGWNFYTCPSSSVTATTPTIFFYAGGWRDKNGLTNSTNGDGNYHSAFQYGTATANSNNMCYFSFGTSKLELTNTQSKSLGASVRPVKE